MTRLAGALVASGVATGVAGLLAQAPPQQQPVFRSRTDVVTLHVSVKQGRMPVAGLTAPDFEVRDSGIVQRIDSVSRDALPLDLTLVLTGFRSQAQAQHLEGLGSAASVRALVRPGDRLRIVRVNDDVRGGLVAEDYRVPTDNRSNVQIPGISLIDGLFYALAWPVDPDRRHLVVAFTDGYDDFSTLRPDQLPQLAGHSDAVMHLVVWAQPDVRTRALPESTSVTGGAGPAGSGAGRSPSFMAREWDETNRPIIAAAERTGGTVRPSSAGPEALEQILDDFRTSYLIRYSPAGVREGGWHELSVKVTRPGSYTVRARKGYEG